MDEAKKFLERSFFIFIAAIIFGILIELELEYLIPLLMYSGIVNLGYSILNSLKKGKD